MTPLSTQGEATKESGAFPEEKSSQPHYGRWIVAGLILCFLLQAELVINRPINWDEFYHLTVTHALHEGRFHSALQVLFQRVFLWLPLLPLDGVDQVRIARLGMLGCEVFTTYAIYRVARRFTGQVAAGLAALAYVSGSYVFEHGFAYRADPMAAALLMGALWVMLESRLGPRAILLIAALIALGFLTTIKIILYAPAFAGVAWLRWREAEDHRAMLFRLAALFAATVLLTAVATAGFILSLPSKGSVDTSMTISTSATMMFNGALFPRLRYIVLAGLFAPALMIIVIMTPLQLYRSSLGRDKRLALAGLFLPLASLAVYQNSFPYFYVFILPPVIVASAVSLQVGTRYISPIVLVLALLSSAFMASARTPREVLHVQKEVIAAVHHIFPEPVPYFDFPGMIAEFPKANFFMTEWGNRKYRMGLEPSFLDVMAHKVVPLLILNESFLVRNQTGPKPVEPFLKEDGLALREAFVHHWGPLWVAGRRFSAEEEEANFTTYAPGKYTLEGAPASIDGRSLQAGDTITLVRGQHRFLRAGRGETVLRWGDNLRKPQWLFSGKPLFQPF